MGEPAGKAPGADKRVSRRNVVAAVGLGLLGLSIGPSSAPRPTEKDVPPDVEYLDTTPTPGFDSVLRTFRDPVAGLTPSVFRVVPTAAGDLIAVGCTGVSNQLQFVDVTTGRLVGATDSATSAQRGVQDMVSLPSGGLVLFISSEGIKTASADGEVRLLGRLHGGSTDGYDPQVDREGNVWMGTYGKQGHGTFARIDPRSGTIDVLPPIAGDTDYVSCVAVTERQIWGGTGSSRPRLVSFDRLNPGTYRAHDLPGAAPRGNVQSVHAWNDAVVAGYRLVGGGSVTAVLDPRTGRIDVLERVAERGIVLRRGPEILFFSNNSLRAHHLESRTDREVSAWDTSFHVPRHAWFPSAPGQAILRMVVFSSAEDRYRLVDIDLDTGAMLDARLMELLTSAQKVQTIYSADDGMIYAGGYQGHSVAQVDPRDGRVRRSKDADPAEQVESVVNLDADTLILGSYPGAKIIRYDARDNAERLLVGLETEFGQSRPFGLAIAGGRVVVGCVPSQGQRGGGLTVVNPDTGAVERHLDGVVGAQSIVGLAGFGNRVYGSSSTRSAYGARDDDGSARVFCVEVGPGEVIWSQELPGEGEINSPIRIGDRVYVSVANGIVALGAATGRPVDSFDIYSSRRAAGYRTTRIAWHPGSGLLIHAGGGQLTAVDPVSKSQRPLAKGRFEYPVVGRSGRLFAIRAGREIVEVGVPVR